MTSVGGNKIIPLFCSRQLPVVAATTNSSTRNSNRKILGSTIVNVSSKQQQQQHQREQLQHRWFQTSVSKKLSAVDPATASTLTNATGAEAAASTTTTTTKTIKRVKKVIKKKSIVISSHDKYSGYTATPIGNKGLQQYEWINFAPYGIKIVDYSKCDTTSTTPMSRWPLPQAPSKKPGTYDKRLVFAFLTLFMTGSVYYVYNYSEPLPPGYWEAIERGDMPMENLVQSSSDTSATTKDTTNEISFDDDNELDENYDEWAEEKK